MLGSNAAPLALFVKIVQSKDTSTLSSDPSPAYKYLKSKKKFFSDVVKLGLSDVIRYKYLLFSSAEKKKLARHSQLRQIYDKIKRFELFCFTRKCNMPMRKIRGWYNLVER